MRSDIRGNAIPNRKEGTKGSYRAVCWSKYSGDDPLAEAWEEAKKRTGVDTILSLKYGRRPPGEGQGKSKGDGHHAPA